MGLSLPFVTPIGAFVALTKVKTVVVKLNKVNGGGVERFNE